MREPLIDWHTDVYFLGEALRQAARPMNRARCPVGAVVVRAGRIIARAGNQVETLKDATARMREMLALHPGRERRRRLAAHRLHPVRSPRNPVPLCRRGRPATRLYSRGVWRQRPKRRRGGRRDELAVISTLNHRCEITSGLRLRNAAPRLQSFFAEQRAARKNGDSEN